MDNGVVFTYVVTTIKGTKMYNMQDLSESTASRAFAPVLPGLVPSVPSGPCSTTESSLSAEPGVDLSWMRPQHQTLKNNSCAGEVWAHSVIRDS